MSDRNEVILEGNLCRDVEIKYANSGTAIASLSVAYNDSYKKGNEYVKQGHFFDVTAFKDTALACSGLTKGTLVHIEGKLSQDRWKDADGKDRSKVKIIAFKVEPMSRQNGQQPQKSGHSETQSQSVGNLPPNNGRPNTAGFKDDIPGQSIDNSDIPF